MVISHIEIVDFDLIVDIFTNYFSFTMYELHFLKLILS